MTEQAKNVLLPFLTICLFYEGEEHLVNAFVKEVLSYLFLPSSSNVSIAEYKFERVRVLVNYKHMGLAIFMTSQIFLI